MRTSSIVNAIREVLGEHHSHLTAKSVYQEIKQKLSAVDQSTVYRALERMVHHGEVSVSDMGGSAVVYELVNQEPHHHLVCEKCKQIIMLQTNEVDDFLQSIGKSSNFQVTTNHLVLFGICPECQKRTDQ